MNLQKLKQHWLWDYITKCERDLMLTHASALAFTSILSLIPMIAMAYFVFNALGGMDKMQGDIEGLIAQNIAPNFGSQIVEFIHKIRSAISAKAIGTFGVLGFAYTSISTLSKIEFAMNKIWGVSKARAFDKKIVIYWSLITIGPVLIGLSIYLSSFAIHWLKEDNGEISRIIIFLSAFIPYLFSGLFFSALYIILPNTPIHKREAIQAGFVTGLVFEIAKQAYAFYAMRAIGKSIYGSLAVLPVFLVWLYLIWVIVLYGAELAYYFEMRRVGALKTTARDHTLSDFLLFDIMEHMVKAAQNQKSGLSLDELMRGLQVGRSFLLQHLDELLSKGLLIQSEKKRGEELRFNLPYDSKNITGDKMAKLLAANYRPKMKATCELSERVQKEYHHWSVPHD